MVKAAARVGLNIIASLGVGTALVLFLWPLVFKENIGLEIVVAIVLSAVNLFLLWIVRPKIGESDAGEDEQIALPVGAEEFANYYRDFYKREGSIYIYCKDTEWLEDPVMKPVVDAIAAKGQRATLCLRVLGEKTTETLKKSGVQIKAVPDSLALEIKMSYQDNGTDKSVIIRGAAKGASMDRNSSGTLLEMNSFTETRNHDIVNLVHTIFAMVTAT